MFNHTNFVLHRTASRKKSEGYFLKHINKFMFETLHFNALLWIYLGVSTVFYGIITFVQLNIYLRQTAYTIVSPIIKDSCRCKVLLPKKF